MDPNRFPSHQYDDVKDIVPIQGHGVNPTDGEWNSFADPNRKTIPMHQMDMIQEYQNLIRGKEDAPEAQEDLSSPDLPQTTFTPRQDLGHRPYAWKEPTAAPLREHVNVGQEHLSARSKKAARLLGEFAVFHVESAMYVATGVAKTIRGVARLPQKLKKSKNVGEETLPEPEQEHVDFPIALPTDTDDQPTRKINDILTPEDIDNIVVSYHSGVPTPPSKRELSFGIKSNGPRPKIHPGKQTLEDIQAKRPTQSNVPGEARITATQTPGERRARRTNEKVDNKRQETLREHELKRELDSDLGDILAEMKEKGTTGNRIVEILNPRTSYRKRRRASQARNEEDGFVYYTDLQRPRPHRASRRFVHKLIPNRVGYDAVDYTDGWVISNNIIDPERASAQRDEEFSRHNSFVAVPLEDPEGNITLDFFRRYSWVEEIDGENRGAAVIDKEALQFEDLPVNLRQQVVRYLRYYQDQV